jgi:hypothetical protein
MNSLKPPTTDCLPGVGRRATLPAVVSRSLQGGHGAGKPGYSTLSAAVGPLRATGRANLHGMDKLVNQALTYGRMWLS